MSNAWDFPAKGKIIEVRGSSVVFQPSNTNYELLLVAAAGNYTGGNYTGPLNSPIEILIRVQARKVWTVPSGGNFVEPIFGKPRTIQGWVKAVDQSWIVLQAGAPIVVKLPTSDSAIDFNSGSIAVGSMVNAMVMPGATFEVAKAAVAGG
jgi:hypothetical protein